MASRKTLERRAGKKGYTIWKRAEEKCHYCGKLTIPIKLLQNSKIIFINHEEVNYFNIYNIEETRRIASVDHVIPLSKNGHSRNDNLVCACTVCNNKKGNT